MVITIRTRIMKIRILHVGVLSKSAFNEPLFTLTPFFWQIRINCISETVTKENIKYLYLVVIPHKKRYHITWFTMLNHALSWTFFYEALSIWRHFKYYFHGVSSALRFIFQLLLRPSSSTLQNQVWFLSVPFE